MLDIRCSRVLLIIILLSVTSQNFAQTKYPTIIESATPTTLSQLDNAAKAQNVAKKPIGDIMQWTSLQLLGKPYEAALLDRSTPEYLYISLNQTDCMLFIEEVYSYSKMIKNKQQGVDYFTNGIKDVRYHGEVAYCNRNHYFKDWAITNINKGLFVDEAARLTHQYLKFSANVLSKTIASMPAHADDLACIQDREKYVDTLTLGFIPLKDLAKYLPRIKSGDIIGIIRTPNGRADSIHHLGIAYVHEGKVSLIDASSIYKKVVIEDTLIGYLAKFKNSEGIILLRAK